MTTFQVRSMCAVAACSLALSAMPANAAPVNLMSNAGFESGLTAYVESNGYLGGSAGTTFTTAATTVLPRSGTNSGALTVNKNGDVAVGLYALYQDIDVSSYAVGETFTVSGYAAQSVTDPMVAGPVLSIYVEWLNASGGRTDIDFGFPGGVPTSGAYPATPSWSRELTKDSVDTVTARYFFGIQTGAGSEGRGTAHFDDLSFSVDAVPEPASLALLASGAVLLIGRRRRA